MDQVTKLIIDSVRFLAEKIPGVVPYICLIGIGLK